MVSERDEQFRKLFLAAQAGDNAAYRVLLDRVAQLLRAYLMKTMNPRLRSVQQVEDLVQEVLISFHRKRDLYSADRPFFPWIYAIARYRLIDSLRTEARRPECVEWIEKFDAAAYVEMPELFQVEAGAEILEGLTERQKEILRMAKVDEMPMTEIAEKFGMSLSAVKVTIHRSLKVLRKRLEERN